MAYRPPPEVLAGLRTTLDVGTTVVGTDTRVFGGLDDGFGDDHFARRVAHQRARANGMSVSGMKYFPALVPEGGGVGHPNGWAKDAGDLRRNAETLRNIDGDTVIIDGVGRGIVATEFPKPEKPYTVAEDLVQKEADEVVVRDHGGRIRMDDYDVLCHGIREKRSCRAPGDDE